MRFFQQVGEESHGIAGLETGFSYAVNGSDIVWENSPKLTFSFGHESKKS